MRRRFEWCRCRCRCHSLGFSNQENLIDSRVRNSYFPVTSRVGMRSDGKIKDRISGDVVTAIADRQYRGLGRLVKDQKTSSGGMI